MFSRTIIIVILFVSVVFTNLFAQSNKSNMIDSNYYGYWLNEDYYNALMNGVTPLEAYKFNKPYIAIIILEEQNKIGFSRYLNEIGFIDFSVTNSLLQFEDRYEKKVFTLPIIDSNKIVLIENSENITTFRKYPKKYQGKDSSFGGYFPHYLINDVFFNGEYVTLDSLKNKITFSLNGEVTGIPEFTTYYVFANYLFNKDYNSIRFGSPSRKRNLPIFAWEKSGDTLSLFSTEDTLGLNRKKGNVFLKLLKMN